MRKPALTLTRSLPEKNELPSPRVCALAGTASLDQFDLDIKQQRFASYFAEVNSWNENYAYFQRKLISSRQEVFREAGKSGEVSVFQTKIWDMSIAQKPFNDELRRSNLDASSLNFGLHNSLLLYFDQQ